MKTELLVKRDNRLLNEYWNLVTLYHDSSVAVNVASRLFEVTPEYLYNLLDEEGIL